MRSGKLSGSVRQEHGDQSICADNQQSDWDDGTASPRELELENAEKTGDRDGDGSNYGPFGAQAAVGEGGDEHGWERNQG